MKKAENPLFWNNVFISLRIFTRFDLRIQINLKIMNEQRKLGCELPQDPEGKKSHLEPLQRQLTVNIGIWESIYQNPFIKSLPGEDLSAMLVYSY